ncbi:hypothetical protein Zmor_014782 [Zophobas morio]|uniref:Uncharacterized protein n=1 Tax=Zophobas morio TaxID=2755281 RepID=A0AA38IKA3_9CUCU|nr:hypothetical protein Zmor_014782 [Zophobas morio]
MRKSEGYIISSTDSTDVNCFDSSQLHQKTVSTLEMETVQALLHLQNSQKKDKNIQVTSGDLVAPFIKYPVRTLEGCITPKAKTTHDSHLPVVLCCAILASVHTLTSQFLSKPQWGTGDIHNTQSREGIEPTTQDVPGKHKAT